MIDKHIAKISKTLDLGLGQVRATVDLLKDDATVPFIARYRKEATGSLDEVAVTAIRDQLDQLEELDKRRESILKSLGERNLLSDELTEKIQAAETMAVLEDIYLPYKPKRRTRAMIAREKGLEPLAELLFQQDPALDPRVEAEAYVDPEKGVEDAEAALAGARDIIAEGVNESEEARAAVRHLFERQATVKSRVLEGKEEAGAKFRDYFDWEEQAAEVPSHRILAMRRGEGEGVLSLRIRPDDEPAMELLESMFVAKGGYPAAEQVRLAVRDGYQRLLSPSMETEMRLMVKKRADEEAIRVFTDNLRELLLSPPLGRKSVLALDPGFRTGCKIACLDRQGALCAHETIFPFASSEREKKAAGETVRRLCREWQIEAVAIGNGTASRETEQFVRSLNLPAEIPVIMVNESGASVYSASEAARQEFPNLDLTYRGSVSIGRRLLDPLAELVKIDPKSIGVGQYQHDVNQAELKKSLDDTVVSCVNRVGVEINTASQQLLSYVSGLGPQLAKNIIVFRNENGAFKSRKQLTKVPRLGPKAFEQAAGFLRIREGENPLDSSAVHPESYHIVQTMADKLGCTVQDLMRDDGLRERLNLSEFVTEKVGMPTLTDIVSELAKPGRDPREQFEVFSFTEGVSTIADLEVGMTLPGIVTNVTAFGAFVDIGVHQDGLVHISQLSDQFIKDPHQVVKVHQKVSVTVVEVDIPRNRIGLSMKNNPETGRKTQAAERTGRPGGGSGKKQDQRRPDKREKPKPEPFNNPFADVFKKQQTEPGAPRMESDGLAGLKDRCGLLLTALTGGIATGKSAVAAMLAAMGGRVIDFDDLARRVVSPGRPAWQDIVANFGREILLPDETIDRKKLARLVFQDPEKRLLLERLTHGRISDEFIRDVEAIREDDRLAIIIAVIPLLYEVRMAPYFHRSILVYAPPETQIERLMRRDRIDRDHAESILKAQMPIDDKRALADFVIDNRGSLDDTREQAAVVWGKIKEIQRDLF